MTPEEIKRLINKFNTESQLPKDPYIETGKRQIKIGVLFLIIGFIGYFLWGAANSSYNELYPSRVWDFVFIAGAGVGTLGALLIRFGLIRTASQHEEEIAKMFHKNPFHFLFTQPLSSHIALIRHWKNKQRKTNLT